MQNNKSKGFRSFLKEKGYYIVLLLCAVAVGTSGYFLLKSNKIPSTNESTSVTAPGATETPPATSGQATDVIATEGNTPTAPTAPQKMQIVPPVEGEVLNAFAADYLAYNATTRDWRTHEGVDFKAALGQDVVAAAEGTVYTVYEDESFGMTVVVHHADGYATYYSNLGEEVAVTAGQTVSAGTVLGTIGQTACIETVTEPHLHFAVYQNNNAIDPLDFLNQ